MRGAGVSWLPAVPTVQPWPNRSYDRAPTGRGRVIHWCTSLRGTRAHRRSTEARETINHGRVVRVSAPRIARTEWMHSWFSWKLRRIIPTTHCAVPRYMGRREIIVFVPYRGRTPSVHVIITSSVRVLSCWHMPYAPACYKIKLPFFILPSFQNGHNDVMSSHETTVNYH